MLGYLLGHPHSGVSQRFADFPLKIADAAFRV
jgi:hypothetical protein